MMTYIFITCTVSLAIIKLSDWIPFVLIERRLDHELASSDIKKLHVRVDARKTEQGIYEVVLIASTARYWYGTDDITYDQFIRYAILYKNARPPQVQSMVAKCILKCDAHNRAVKNKIAEYI